MVISLSVFSVLLLLIPRAPSICSKELSSDGMFLLADLVVAVVRCGTGDIYVRWLFLLVELCDVLLDVGPMAGTVRERRRSDECDGVDAMWCW